MKCPYCFTENNIGKQKCGKCGAFLLHGTKVTEEYTDFLIKNGIIGSLDELMQLKNITVSCRCDDGLGLPPGLEISIEVPLYYTEREIISIVKQKGVCPQLSDVFFRIDEFHDGIKESHIRSGRTVLAEAVSENLMRLELHMIVSTRQAMLAAANA